MPFRYEKYIETRNIKIFHILEYCHTEKVHAVLVVRSSFRNEKYQICKVRHIYGNQDIEKKCRYGAKHTLNKDIKITISSGHF